MTDSRFFRPGQTLEIDKLNVRYWHKAETPIAPDNVCYWGKADKAETYLKAVIADLQNVGFGQSKRASNDKAHP